MVLLRTIQLILALWPSCDAFRFRRETARPTVSVLAPGLVLVRNAVSEEDQQRLASEAARVGRRNDGTGFLNADGVYNADAARGRIYDRCSRLPASLIRACSKSVQTARKAGDCELPACRPSHCLINYYTSAKGLLWHRDIYANDGDGEAPIVNLSLGASCIFGVQDEHNHIRHIRLKSGDALLFGGASRFVRHAVLKVLLDEKPRWMKQEDAYRLSFTFRQAHSVLGQEEHYRTFKVQQKWFQKTQRTWRPGDPLVCSPRTQV